MLFGQSPNSLKEDAHVANDKDFTGSGGYFSRRITAMLKTQNFNKSGLKNGNCLMNLD